jgi:DNA-binding transcriptional LysR family regulator
MEQGLTILYEDSTPARNNISLYDALAARMGLRLNWLLQTSITNGYEQLQNGEADAMLISGREDFHELRKKGFEALISKQYERRLVALFSPSLDPALLNKKNSEPYPLTIAADSEWQAQMVANFLLRALPLRSTPYQFLSGGDDHGFDERLAALSDGRIDIAIVPLAGLNQFNDNNTRKLKHMVLPLFECPPNIYQARTGLIIKKDNQLLADLVKQGSKDNQLLADLVKQGSKDNQLLPELIKQDSDVESNENYLAEASLLAENATASHGIFSEKLPFSSFTYLARPELKRTIEVWDMDAALPAGKKLFSTTDHMKDFFQYEYFDVEKIPDKSISFIASHKAVHTEQVVTKLAGSRVWAAGTRTWFELAKKGLWVEGCADGLGLESLTNSWAGAFTGIDRESVNIITNAESADQWITDGWSATGTYKLIPSITPEIKEGLEEAEMVFWTSYQQYQACRELVKPDLLHASPAGKTASLLKKDGIEKLVVFPSIKAFNWYRQEIYST